MRGFGYLKQGIAFALRQTHNYNVSVPLRGFGYLKHKLIDWYGSGDWERRGFRPLAGIWLSKTDTSELKWTLDEKDCFRPLAGIWLSKTKLGMDTI